MTKKMRSQYETPVTQEFKIVVESDVMACSGNPVESKAVIISEQQGYEDAFAPTDWDAPIQ